MTGCVSAALLLCADEELELPLTIPAGRSVVLLPHPTDIWNTNQTWAPVDFAGEDHSWVGWPLQDAAS